MFENKEGEENNQCLTLASSFPSAAVQCNVVGPPRSLIRSTAQCQAEILQTKNVYYPLHVADDGYFTRPDRDIYPRDAALSWHLISATPVPLGIVAVYSKEGIAIREPLASLAKHGCISPPHPTITVPSTLKSRLLAPTQTR